MSTPMVKATLADIKSLTRRTKGLEKINNAPDQWVQATKHKDGSFIFWGPLKVTDKFAQEAYPEGDGFKCPYGQVGDYLWLRETFAGCPAGIIHYKADGLLRPPNEIINSEGKEVPTHWRPSIFMPRWASRITLEITNVRVERLQEITEEDAIKEGITNIYANYSNSFQIWSGKKYLSGNSAKDVFCQLWDSINGKKYPRSSNPWCWVIEFRRIKND
jgi:hypothetical protein